MAGSSQKFIARNRAPRVQIEYDVELYGAEKKVQLPFVMGVMSDMSGNPEDPLPAVADRKFLEIDVDNFDQRMKSMKPRVAFTVPNTLTGEGSMAVDLTFEAMEDFSPAAIARKVEPLRQLLDARTQLANLLTYMDGKSSAEALIEQVLQDRGLLSALASAPPDGSADRNAALDGLRAVAPPPVESVPDVVSGVLDGLRASSPAAGRDPDQAGAALAALRVAAPPPDAQADDTSAIALAALRAAAPAEATPDAAPDALAALRAAAPVAAPAADNTADALAALRATTPAADAAPSDGTADTLAALRAAAPVTEATEENATAEALAALRAATPVTEATESDDTADTLAALRVAAPAEPAPDEAAEALAALRAAAPLTHAAGSNETADALIALRTAMPVTEATEPDGTADALAALRAAAPVTETTDENATAEALAALRAATPVTEATESDDTADTLAALRVAAPAEPVPDDAADALAALRAAVPMTEATKYDDAAKALAALRAATPADERVPDDAADALAALRAAAPVSDATPSDGTADTLAALRAAAPAEAAPQEATDALAALRAVPPVTDWTEPDDTDDALAALRAAAPPPETAAADDTREALAALRSVTLPVESPEDDPTSALATLRAVATDSVVPEKDATAGALDALRAVVPLAEPQPDAAADALAALRAAAAPSDPAPDERADVLAALLEASAATTAPKSPGSDDGGTLGGLDALLGSPIADRSAPEAAETAVPDDPMAGLGDLLAPAGPVVQQAPADPLAGLDDLMDAPEDAMADLVGPATSVPPDTGDPLAGLDDLLAVGSFESPAPILPDDPLTGLDDLLSDTQPAAPAEVAAPLAGLNDLPSADAAEADDPLAGLDDLLSADAAQSADPLAGLDDLLSPTSSEADDPLAGLDDLLAPSAAEPDDPLAGLDDLLAPAPPAEVADDPLAGLDALLAEPAPALPPQDDPLAGLDDLLASPAPATAVAAPAAPRKEPAVSADNSAFGRLTAPQPSPEALSRPVFRMAILGDFSGRAARGEMKTGAALAERRAIRFDIDNAEQVIEGFAMNLVLPIGPDGRGISVPLTDLDSLHPDELVENVALFDELKGLRQRLSTPSMAARAVSEMQAWGGAFRTMVMPSASRSAASSVPADLRLTDFQRLIGDREGKLATASPAADFIAQIVGPHIVPGPNPEAAALRGAVDEAMSAAMRLVLHHPEFQSIEAQWRSLDLLARRIETDAKLQIVLFDISAEELAADLSAAADLAQSGLFKLLNAPLTEEGNIGFSAVFGLYTFEETPPHAHLLGRLAKIAQHLQAPVFAAMSPGYQDTTKQDRHPLVARAWDSLRAEPAAAWLGLATPRFLLRRPYGERSEPIDAFDFEEFTMAEGLSGMLWANPVVLVAILLAQAWTEGKGKVVLGKSMSLGEMPYHYATDRHGDQVPLPCTERNMTTDKVEHTVTRGLMPVISIRGRDVVRLGSFQSVAGSEIAGPWSGAPPPAPSAPAPTLAVTIPPAVEATSVDDDLDALLAGFGDAPAAPADPGAIDADLAALLEGL